MPKFTSYGPINEKLHYHVPRTALIDRTLGEVIGAVPSQGGHYITVWAPRQAGKTWILQNVLWQVQENAKYDWIDAVKLNLQDLKLVDDPNVVANELASRLFFELGIDENEISVPETIKDFHRVFTRSVLKKPLVLIMDEFDALQPQVITAIAGVLRNVYIHRGEQRSKTTAEKMYLLHGVALIGVRSVLGIENKSGSPFNTQRSIHIPNLTEDEVHDLFHQYMDASGQTVETDVIERLYYEVRGQPGLTGWFGELMTETFNTTPDQPLTMKEFKRVYTRARDTQPNSNITNLIQKAHEPRYKERVMKLFQTSDKVHFSFDDEELNFLYMNGVIDYEEIEDDTFVKFPNPFVQKRLFNSFATELFDDFGLLHDPYIPMDDIITETSLNVPNILRLYEGYLRKHRVQLLKDAPLRADLHVHEATFHFHLYKYLSDFMRPKGGKVIPEFPTGNGQIDLLLHHANQIYGLEVKSFSGQYEYNQALVQTAKYAKKMAWPIVWLVFFTEQIDEKNRAKYEVTYRDKKRNVVVEPIFIQTN